MSGRRKLALDAHCLTDRRTGVATYVAGLVGGIRETGAAQEVELYVDQLVPEVDGFDAVVVPAAPMWTSLRLSAYLARHPRPGAMLFPAHTLPFLPPRGSVVTLHDLAFELYPEHFTRRDRFRLRATTRHAAMRADHLIAVSEATRRDACELLGVPESRITVVRHGYDSSRFRPMREAAVRSVRARYGIDRPYILSVGTLQSRKNHVALVAAVERLVARGLDVDLVLAGGRGWLFDRLFRSIDASPLRDRVRVLDYVELADLPALYTGAAAFALVSLYEGFGLPVLEALACGAPTLVSDVSSLPEVGGDAVLRADPSDHEAIAAALEQLLTDSQLGRELRSRAVAHLEAFSWARCARETLQVLRSAAHG